MEDEGEKKGHNSKDHYAWHKYSFKWTKGRLLNKRRRIKNMPRIRKRTVEDLLDANMLVVERESFVPDTQINRQSP